MRHSDVSGRKRIPRHQGHGGKPQAQFSCGVLEAKSDEAMPSLGGIIRSEVPLHSDDACGTCECVHACEVVHTDMYTHTYTHRERETHTQLKTV